MSGGEEIADYVRDTVFAPPPGVEVRRGPHGLSLHVTHPLRAGQVIYRAQELHIPDDGRTYRTRVLVGGVVEDIDITPMHTVRYRGMRAFDIPGCFMNHSCDPSSVSRDVLFEGGENAYEEVAVKDLAPGDEITCDYTLFDWDCDGHQFMCACGSEHCYGFIGGFASLPRHIQERLADSTCGEAARMWKLTQPGA